jgi:polysaccharide export outer membrane protein
MKNKIIRVAAGFSFVLLLTVSTATPSSWKHLANPLGSGGSDDKSSKPSEYTIGPDDLLSIYVADAAEFGGKFRVSDAGMIEIPSLPAPVLAEGKTPIELAHAIRDALIKAKQLRDPSVRVLIEEYRGRTITVLGSVSKPAVYSLQKRTTVLEALSMAGGALPGGGNTATVVRGKASAESTGTAVGSVVVIPLSKLTSGDSSAENVELQNGDILNISAAQVIYVVGSVIKPGGYVMSDPSSGISVVQAIALAEGFNSVASTSHGLIIRQSTSDTSRREVEVDISQMMTGKEPDMLLAPNDILYIPPSNLKRTLKVMGEIAMSAVNGIAIYGVGYRVANVH